MNIILYHLDELLDFHREYDKYYRAPAPEGITDDFFKEIEDELEENRKIWRRGRSNSLSKISGTIDKLDKRYIVELYEILIEDKYIIPKKNHKRITLKGIMFEGYVNQKNRLKSQADLLSLNTWLISIGTALTGSYVLFQFLNWLIHHSYL